jgi:hypothetical protein
LRRSRVSTAMTRAPVATSSCIAEGTLALGQRWR